MWLVARVSSVLSLTVLVVAQKKAADSTHPMGIARWNPLPQRKKAFVRTEIGEQHEQAI